MDSPPWAARAEEPPQMMVITVKIGSRQISWTRRTTRFCGLTSSFQRLTRTWDFFLYESH